LVLERNDFEQLLQILKRRDYRLVGPTVREGAIVYDELGSAADLPVGWRDEQNGASYRLKRRSDQALFGYVVGPHSTKRFFHPPAVRLWQAKREGRGFQVEEEKGESPKTALIGLRSCDLHAIAVQDRVFLHGPQVDPLYRARRENAFIIAINCGKAGGTCFCASMNTGPKATLGFDLALTEVLEDGRHYFVVEPGTEKGFEVLREVPTRPAQDKEVVAADLLVQRTAAQMGRSMETAGIKELLYRNYEHPRWDEVARRCLACAT
jgi:hypothetical protein